MLGDKLMSLAEGDHDHILGYINEYDDEVQHQCHNIEAAIDRIVEKQREMTDVFGSMIDNFIANQNEQVFHTGQQNIAAGIMHIFAALFYFFYLLVASIRLHDHFFFFQT